MGVIARGGVGRPAASSRGSGRRFAGALSAAGAGTLRRGVGAVLLGALGAVAILDPRPAGGSGPAIRAALQSVTGPWLPTFLAVALPGALAGALLARARAGALAKRGESPGLAPVGPGVPGWAGAALACGAGLATALVAGVVFGGAPMHVDAIVQAFQARVLRGGALIAPAPPLGEFFASLNTVLEGDRWFGQFPPGWPFLLALAGEGAGRLLLQGVVAAVGSWAVYRAGAAVHGRGSGLLAAALFAFSPFALLLSASGLNHAAAAALAAVAFWLALGTDTTRRPRLGAALCGLAAGALITVRPLDGLVVSACVLPLALAGPTGAPIAARARAVALTGGLLVPVVLLGLYNRATTGSVLELGYTHLWGPGHGLGFHLSPWGGPHTPVRGLFHLQRDLWSLNAQVFGAALPLLPAAALPLLLGPSRVEGAPPQRLGRVPSRMRAEACLYALFLAVPGSYVFYWHHDWFLGPRYLFTVLPFFALLVARGIVLLGRATRRRGIGNGPLLGALLAGVVWLAVVEAPTRMGEASALLPGFRLDVAREARAAGVRRGVVFVKESWGSRLLARLRARGLSAAETERTYRTADHCALQLVLDEPSAGRVEILAALAADRRKWPAPVFDRQGNGDPSLRLRPGDDLAPRCRDEIAYDRAAPYGAFSPQLARIDPWLRDVVVVARDLRGENPRLLAALGRSQGYLYVPGRPGHAGTFLPLEPR